MADARRFVGVTVSDRAVMVTGGGDGCLQSDGKGEQTLPTARHSPGHGPSATCRLILTTTQGRHGLPAPSVRRLARASGGVGVCSWGGPAPRPTFLPCGDPPGSESLPGGSGRASRVLQTRPDWNVSTCRPRGARAPPAGPATTGGSSDSGARCQDLTLETSSIKVFSSEERFLTPPPRPG